jgi:peroxiredoxin
MTLLALGLAAIFVAFVCWFGFELLQQNGRILARLEALQDAMDRASLAPPADDASDAGARDRRNATLAGSRLERNGLDRGTPAPDFQIARVGGGTLSPSEFRGRPLLLVFSDPDCAPCNVLAPQLERWSRAEGAQVVMVSRGDIEANQAKIAEHRLSFPVGLQRHWEISRLYAMFATPIAYLIDGEGIIAAPVAKGPQAILDLSSRAAGRRSPGVSASSTPVGATT